LNGWAQLVLLTSDKVAVSSDGPVFLGCDDQDARWRFRGRDVGVGAVGAEVRVFRGVDMNAGEGQRFAHGGADIGGIFADAGGDPHPVTNFTSGRTFGFAWSRDGKNLYLTKGEIQNDVVLISNFR
jgi:hypothetical protein